MGFESKFKRIVNSAKGAATQVANIAIETKNNYIQEKEEAKRKYEEQVKNADLVIKVIAEEVPGPKMGDCKITVDGIGKYDVSLGSSLEIPIQRGTHSIKVKYVVFKNELTYDFENNTTLLFSYNSGSDNMQVDLKDSEGNLIPESDYSKKSDLISKLSEKTTVTSEKSDAYLDADIRVFGKNGQLFVYDNRVIIERKGIENIANFGLTGSKTIPMSNITSVQVKEAGTTFGYIQFGILGGVEAKGGLMKAMEDENTIATANNSDIKAVKEYIEKRIYKTAVKETEQTDTSKGNAEEILKYKNLMDQGIITKEEYEKKKQQLLGI